MAVSCLMGALAGGAVVADVQNPESAAQTARDGPIPVVDRFLDAADIPLVSYRAVRHLHAAARNERMRATLTAVTSLDPDGVFDFDVLEETGSGLIRSKVLRAALDAERRAHASDERARGALTRRNYEFAPGETTVGGIVRVGIRPRREDTMLVEGSILLTPDLADLLQIEGRLVKRPSFWTRRVDVVRHYARVAGVRVPVAMESTAEVLLAGRSTFTMRYEYEAVNGLRLTPPDAPALQGAGTGQ